VPMRRHLIPAHPAGEPAARTGEPDGRELRAALHDLRERTEEQLEEMREAYATTERLAQQGADLRERVRANRRTPA
jgi:hypothetical protein